jgi:hypothetical protein
MCDRFGSGNSFCSLGVCFEQELARQSHPSRLCLLRVSKSILRVCARFALMRGPGECSLERRSPELGETYPSAIYLGPRIIAIDSPARIIALDLPFHLVAGWQGGTTN